MKNQELRARVIAYNKAVAADRKVAEIVKAVGLEIADRPMAPPNRPGYSWIPHLSTTSKTISWVESEYDPTLPGTAENPIPYEADMTVYPNYYYIFDGVRKVWMDAESCIEPEWDDERFAEI